MAGRTIAIVLLSAIGWPVIEPHVVRNAAAVDDAAPVPLAASSVGAPACTTFAQAIS